MRVETKICVRWVGKVSRQAGGFGLLEVLVALAILAAAGGAMFSWLAQTLDTASRLRRADDESRLSLNALAMVSLVNPLSEPQGRRELAGIRINWTSAPVQPVVDGRSFVDGHAGDWRVGLFKITADVEDFRHGTTVRLEVIQPGLTQRAAAGLQVAR
ncbi:MAG: hypothetical protein C0423_21605 [Methylibium sp.]|nr:hypothetical protein [Methylibium sp.]